MLRSYQYTEKSYLDYSMQSNLFQTKEIVLARQYVENSHIRKNMKRNCPICNEDTGKYFFTKWDVDYLCCEKCKSIFAVCDEEDAVGYLKYKDLISLRLSEEYQAQITESRQAIWKEFVEWIEVRAFRFMGRNRELNIIDVGNRLSGFCDMVKCSPICGKYELRNSILQTESLGISESDADVILYNDVIKNDFHFTNTVASFHHSLKPDGILIIGARAGSGFDIITLREQNSKIYPYEHILLPSAKGLIKFLKNSGFEVLEITTPGVMDVKYVLEDLDKLNSRESFVRHLLTETNEAILQEFQRFLQKSCMSSFVRVIARKVKKNETV